MNAALPKKNKKAKMPKIMPICQAKIAKIMPKVPKYRLFFCWGGPKLFMPKKNAKCYLQIRKNCSLNSDIDGKKAKKTPTEKMPKCGVPRS